MSGSPFDEDNLRKLAKLTETPATRLAQEVAKSPNWLLEQVNVNTDLQRLVRGIEDKTAFAAAVRGEQWPEFSSFIASAQATLQRPETAAAIRDMDEKLKLIALAANEAFLPFVENIRSLTNAAALAVQPYQAEFAKLEAWQSSLASRIAGLNIPWAFENQLGVSVVGFARIARLHDVVVGASPFDPASSAIIKEELGDPVPFDANAKPSEREAASIDAGLNPEILALPADAYPSILISAGFEFRIDAARPIIPESGDTSGAVDPQHAGLLGQVENRLRDLIQTELQRVAGDGWLSRVNSDVRQKWQERKDRDQLQRGDSFHLLFYADFMELVDIILKRQNWNEVFRQFFVSQQDFQISMQRLSPVRNAISHNRPLVRSDQITLFSESFRILNALGVRL